MLVGMQHSMKLFREKGFAHQVESKQVTVNSWRLTVLFHEIFIRITVVPYLILFMFLTEVCCICNAQLFLFCSGPISRDMYHKVMIDVPQDLKEL